MKYVISLLILAAGVVAFIALRSWNDAPVSDILSTGSVIRKMNIIHNMALSYEGTEDESFTMDAAFGKKLNAAIASKIEHPSDLSRLAICLWALRERTPDPTSGTWTWRHSQYIEIIGESFWYCVFELANITGAAAMEEMGFLYQYLHGVGQYDGGNALQMRYAMESQQFKASRERGEKLFWRIDPWILQNRLSLAGNIESCYWRNWLGNNPTRPTEYMRGYIELREGSIQNLMERSAWTRLEQGLPQFEVPDKSKIADKFISIKEYYEPKSTLKEFTTEHPYRNGRLILNPKARVVYFELEY